MNKLDKLILNRIQRDIPFERKPWKIIAKELNISENILLKRIDFLKKEGIIRRISAVFNPRKVGFSSTLAAARVAPCNIIKVAQKLNSYPEVTHNYERDAEYNIWFTLVAKNRGRIIQILNQLKKDKCVEGVAEFPTVKLFKIEVNFAVGNR